MEKAKGEEMKKLRIKQTCSHCKHLLGFPYIHCRLECRISSGVESGIIIASPKDLEKCKAERQAHEGRNEN